MAIAPGSGNATTIGMLGVPGHALFPTRSTPSLHCRAGIGQRFQQQLGVLGRAASPCGVVRADGCGLQMIGRDELPYLLPEVHGSGTGSAVAATRGIIDRVISGGSTDPAVINVGRGSTIDEAAFTAAIHQPVRYDVLEYERQRYRRWTADKDSTPGCGGDHRHHLAVPLSRPATESACRWSALTVAGR